jgi:hypothetical protein
MSLSSLSLLLLVNFDQPGALGVLVLALVTPLGDPVASRLVVNLVAVALLVFDTLLGGKALPLGLLLGLGDRLLTWKGHLGRGENEVNALGGGLDLAGGEQLVDESLCGIASSGGQSLFVCLGGNRVRVVGEQVAQVECEGGGLVDGDGTV